MYFNREQYDKHQVCKSHRNNMSKKEKKNGGMTNVMNICHVLMLWDFVYFV